jgi:hypothetical protein
MENATVVNDVGIRSIVMQYSLNEEQDYRDEIKKLIDWANVDFRRKYPELLKNGQEGKYCFDTATIKTNLKDLFTSKGVIPEEKTFGTKVYRGINHLIDIGIMSTYGKGKYKVTLKSL